ncbi:MAG: hypothetical protein ACRDLM_10720 [Gaiellaceae bacterium]
MVSTGAARSMMTLLYGANGVVPAVENESGSRCYTVAELTALGEARAGTLDDLQRSSLARLSDSQT